MRTFLHAFVMMLLCIGTAAARTPGQKLGISFDATEYEFGNIKESSQPITHVFTYTNNGDSFVAVLWAKSSCGCTTPEYDRAPLRPGKSTTVKVTFDPRGQAGEVNKSVRLRMRSGTGHSEEVTLRITGVVIPDNTN